MSSNQPKYLPLTEARKLGIFQEINRLLLHPRGLALAFELDTTTDEVTRICGIWDFRSDSAGITFAFEDMPDKAENAVAFEALNNKSAERKRLFGWVVQPIAEK